MNKKATTAMLYVLEIPFGVWAGFLFAMENYIGGIGITVVMMVLEYFAVVNWMDAQTNQIVEKMSIDKGATFPAKPSGSKATGGDTVALKGDELP